jgi:cyclopropane fatty-acyl-phospholipid synthase-like methyltransferase
MIRRVKDLRSRLWDWRLGIETTGECRPPDTSRFKDARKSGSLDYGIIAYHLRLLEIQPSDIVYDIGCGLGRPLCMFARTRAMRCVGIELDPEIAWAARTNAARLISRRAEIEVRQGDAADAEYDGGTVFWLGNPFGPKTLAAVLDKIRLSVRAQPRAVRFCYINPESEEAFAAATWLRRYRQTKMILHPIGHASFWRNQQEQSFSPDAIERS